MDMETAVEEGLLERKKDDAAQTAHRGKPDLRECVLLGICMGFYLIFPMVDGPVWCVDSREYVTMGITREPLYPCFLAVCRGIAGVLKADELMTAVVIQSLFAGLAAWYAGYVIRRVKNDSRILQAAAIFFQFAVTLLCRFAANRRSAYSDCILTEGLGFSLFLFFILFLFLYSYREEKKYLFLTLLSSFLLISLRKQMMITLLICGGVFFWYVLLKKRRAAWFLCLCLMLAGVLLTSKLYDRTYQYLVRGVWMEHSGNSMGILFTLLYSSDRERDRELFTDETVEALYEQIMEQAWEQELLHPFAQPGWLPVSTHYADSYDAIGYGIINPVVEGYLAENFEYSETEAARKYDEICGEMTRTLFRQNKMPMLQVYVYNTEKGFVNSVAQASPVLWVYALAAYCFMGGAACCLIRQKRRMSQEMENKTVTGAWAEKMGGMIVQIEASLCFSFVVMAGIAVNALVVGLFIFAQPRYMIYGMGLFYAAACMLLYDIRNCFSIKRALDQGGKDELSEHYI